MIRNLFARAPVGGVGDGVLRYGGGPPDYIFEDFLNILRRQRDEDIANQNRAIIAAIIAANVGGPVAPAPAPVPMPVPAPVLAAIIAANAAANVVPPNRPPANNAQQDSNDPNIGCIGTPDDPNIGCVPIAQ